MDNQVPINIDVRRYERTPTYPDFVESWLKKRKREELEEVGLRGLYMLSHPGPRSPASRTLPDLVISS